MNRIEQARFQFALVAGARDCARICKETNEIAKLEEILVRLSAEIGRLKRGWK